MKKYIIALGGLGTIITPLVSVISCSNSETKGKTELTGDSGTDEVTPDQGSDQANLLTKKIGDYLKDNNDEIKKHLNTARANSKNQVELKTNLIKNILDDLLLDFNDDESVGLDLEVFAKKNQEAMFIKNLNFTKGTPKEQLKRRGSYGLTWVKGSKPILEFKDMKFIHANQNFWKDLDIAFGDKGIIGLAIGGLKLKPDDEKIIELAADLLKDKFKLSEEKITKLKSLSINAGDLKKIIFGIEKIVFNIDTDLSKIFKAKDKLGSILAMLNNPKIIINKAELNKGIQDIIRTIADLAIRNKDHIRDIFAVIESLKPGLISKKLQNLIISISKSDFYETFFTKLKAIKITQIEALEDIVLKFIKNNDFKYFDIMKIITKKENMISLNNIFNTLGISYVDLLKGAIDNFDAIKPLIPFLNKLETLTKDHIYKLIESLKKDKDGKPLTNNDAIIKNVLSLSLGDLVSKMKDAGILYENGKKLIEKFFGVTEANKKTNPYYAKPILSYEFLASLGKILKTHKLEDNLPKNIVSKLKKLFEYLETLKTLDQKKTFTDDLEKGMENGLKLILNRNNAKESSTLLNKVLNNPTFSKFLSLLQ